MSISPSSPEVDPLAQLLADQDNVAARHQLLDVVSEDWLDWRIRSDRWQVVHPGIVVAHSGPLDAAQRRWADLLSCGPGAVLAGLTAATADGLVGHVPDRPQYLVPHQRQVTDRDDLEVHSTTRLGPEHVHPVRQPPRTRMARSLVDAASWARNDSLARVVLSAGVQQRLVTADDLILVTLPVRNLKRRRLILGTAVDVGGGSHSLPELDFLALCRSYGLPPPTRQVVRRDSTGRRRWLDVCWEEYGLVVEVDGLFHMDAEQWWADMWRGNDHTVGLEGVLRYPSFAIRREPRRVAEQTAAALRARGWDGRGTLV
jgi:hypothetical protein